MKKELNLYEVLYLLNSNITEKELSQKIDSYKDIIINAGSQVMIENRGKRQLSYPIKGFENANYIQMLYIGNGLLVSQLNSLFTRDDLVLRHITNKIKGTVEL